MNRRTIGGLGLVFRLANALFIGCLVHVIKLLVLRSIYILEKKAIRKQCKWLPLPRPLIPSPNSPTTAFYRVIASVPGTDIALHITLIHIPSNQPDSSTASSDVRGRM
jgi:hypothetical protein